MSYQGAPIENAIKYIQLTSSKAAFRRSSVAKDVGAERRQSVPSFLGTSNTHISGCLQTIPKPCLTSVVLPHLFCHSLFLIPNAPAFLL